MIRFSKLLVDFISCIQKFINHTIEACAITFLIFRFQANVIQADVKRTRLKTFTIVLVISVPIYVAIHLVVVHHLSNRQILEAVRVPRELKIIREYLHYHSFPGSRSTDNKKIFVNLVIFIRKHLLCITAAVEIIQEKTQNFRIIFVNFKLSKFFLGVIVANAANQITVSVILVWYRQIIFKTLKNSLPVSA